MHLLDSGVDRMVGDGEDRVHTAVPCGTTPSPGTTHEAGGGAAAGEHVAPGSCENVPELQEKVAALAPVKLALVLSTTVLEPCGVAAAVPEQPASQPTGCEAQLPGGGGGGGGSAAGLQLVLRSVQDPLSQRAEALPV